MTSDIPVAFLINSNSVKPTKGKYVTTYAIRLLTESISNGKTYLLNNSHIESFV